MIPAQPVTPSVAIGPDGYYYIGELKGFPAPTGFSRVWRINPAARHVACSADPAVTPDCTVVADGFTSIIDLAFDRNGTMYVTELDEASWFAVEVTHTPIGGTVNACTLNAGTLGLRSVRNESRHADGCGVRRHGPRLREQPFAPAWRRRGADEQVASQSLV